MSAARENDAALLELVAAAARGDERGEETRLAQLEAQIERHGGPRKPNHLDRPLLECSPLDRAVSENAWNLLREANDADPCLFRYGDSAARIRRTDSGQVVVEPLTETTFRAELDARMRCEQHRKQGWTPTYPPTDLAKMMLGEGTPPLPVLRGVSRVPVFTAAGTLRTTPGYHPADRLLLDPDHGFLAEPVPPVPTATDVLEARARLTDLLQDFPLGPADKTHAVGLVVLSVARELVLGPTPMHAIDASVRGAGKGLLRTALLWPAFGDQTGATVAVPDSEDEMRKLVTSALAEARLALNFDNLGRRLTSAVLSKCLTDTEHEDRLLGGNRIARFPVRCLWTVTGNNLTASDELVRRLVPIRLVPAVECPEERTGFAHHPLLEWVRAERARLLWAGHVLVQHWLAIGRPGPADGTPELGSYESWRHVVGGILTAAGYTHFLAGRDHLRVATDPETEHWRDFVTLWAQRFGEADTTTAELVPLAQETGIRVRGKTEKQQATALGSLLGHRRDRIIAGRRITRAASNGFQRFWCLEQQEGQP